ncbi:hypothetical protein evm_011866 [Chilo suppressalis]|nr:hypothetical protein evm_011866 [Chilo suppressalis]
MTSKASNGQLVSEPNLTLDFSNILKPVSHHLENDLNHDHKIGNKFSNENLTTSHVITESGENVITNNDDPNHTMVNIEAFFNDTPEKNVMLYDIDCEPWKPDRNYNDDKSPVSEVYIQDNPDLITNMVPLSTVISQEEQEEVVTLESPQNNNMFSATLRKFMVATEQGLAKSVLPTSNLGLAPLLCSANPFIHQSIHPTSLD